MYCYKWSWLTVAELPIVLCVRVKCQPPDNAGIGLTDTRELEGMASLPKNENMFAVQKFDELAGLIDTIFGGEGGTACSEFSV